MLKTVFDNFIKILGLIVAAVGAYYAYAAFHRAPVPLDELDQFLISQDSQGDFFLSKQQTVSGGFVRVFVCDETLRMDLQLERQFHRPNESYPIEAMHAGRTPNMSKYVVFLIEAELDNGLMVKAEYWDKGKQYLKNQGPFPHRVTCHDLEF